MADVASGYSWIFCCHLVEPSYNLSLLLPFVFAFLISCTTASYTSIVVAEAGIAPMKLVPIPEYKARQPSSCRIYLSVLTVPRYTIVDIYGLPLVLFIPFYWLLASMDEPLYDGGLANCCICNLVWITSCGYVAAVAYALLAELAARIPKTWNSPWSLRQFPSPIPV